jgi:hypothetical protein
VWTVRRSLALCSSQSPSPTEMANAPHTPEACIAGTVRYSTAMKNVAPGECWRAFAHVGGKE